MNTKTKYLLPGSLVILLFVFTVQVVAASSDNVGHKGMTKEELLLIEGLSKEALFKVKFTVTGSPVKVRFWVDQYQNDPQDPMKTEGEPLFIGASSFQVLAEDGARATLYLMSKPLPNRRHDWFDLEYKDTVAYPGHGFGNGGASTRLCGYGDVKSYWQGQCNVKFEYNKPLPLSFIGGIRDGEPYSGECTSENIKDLVQQFAFAAVAYVIVTNE